jgi:hypothetical protein
MKCFRISDFFFTMTKTKTLILKAYLPKKQEKKEIFHSTFHVGTGIRDEKMFGSGSRIKKLSVPAPLSGIKHPGSDTPYPTRES